MYDLSVNYINENIADSDIIFQRGIHIYEAGAYYCTTFDPDMGNFAYEVDGNYGDYATRINFKQDAWEVQCDCPYPGNGCKHAVGMLLDLKDKLEEWTEVRVVEDEEPIEAEKPLLSREELKKQVMEDRKKRAVSENLKTDSGEITFKGEHLVETERGKQYSITLHDPISGTGHCSCPDFLTSQLEVCKHLFFCVEELKKEEKFEQQVAKEAFPFLDIYWDSISGKPPVFFVKEKKHPSWNCGKASLSVLMSRGSSFLKTFLAFSPTFPN